jgi:hypothetical protein
MPQHVRMRLEAKLRLLASALDHPREAGGIREYAHPHCDGASV